METKTNKMPITANLMIGETEITVQLKTASYEAASEVMRLRHIQIKKLSELDELYKDCFLVKSDGDIEILDHVQADQKSAEITMISMETTIEMFASLMDRKQLTTAEQEAIMREDFWKKQDYIGEIEPAVISFRQRIRI